MKKYGFTIINVVGSVVHEFLVFFFGEIAQRPVFRQPHPPESPVFLVQGVSITIQLPQVLLDMKKENENHYSTSTSPSRYEKIQFTIQLPQVLLDMKDKQKLYLIKENIFKIEIPYTCLKFIIWIIRSILLSK